MCIFIYMIYVRVCDIADSPIYIRYRCESCRKYTYERKVAVLLRVSTFLLHNFQRRSTLPALLGGFVLYLLDSSLDFFSFFFFLMLHQCAFYFIPRRIVVSRMSMESGESRVLFSFLFFFSCDEYGSFMSWKVRHSNDGAGVLWERVVVSFVRFWRSRSR